MDNFRLVELYRDDLRKLIAIEVVELNRRQFNRGGQLYASIMPLAVAVCSPQGNKLMAVDADDAGLDKLKQQHPELAELVAKIC